MLLLLSNKGQAVPPWRTLQVRKEGGMCIRCVMDGAGANEVAHVAGAL